jgi:GR25 family glycosyltransferase involved in LPS biosynthesis
LASGVPRALVLEDDACPTETYEPGRFRDFVARLDPRHQLVFPGCLVMEGLADTPTGTETLAQLHYFNGTFSYLITPEACRFLLDRIFPLRAHVDHQLSNLFIAHRAHFQAYYATPQFFAPDWSLRSDCYVPLSDLDSADKELGDLLRATRQTLKAEGHRLLPLANGS